MPEHLRYNMSIIPIPNRQKTLLSDGKNGNFSLYFPRMVSWLDNEGEKMKDKECIVDLGKESVSRFGAAKTALDNIHKKQKLILEKIFSPDIQVFEFHAKLASPYISGLGAGHPTETGMILDRNTGLPFIPASGIKGVLRLAHALDLAEKAPDIVKANNKGELEISDKIPSMRKYFGDTDTRIKNSVRGQIVFLDAFPSTIPTLKTDIMNPHFGKYYNGEQPPVETESPIPIKFLAVKEGTEFTFRCFVSKLAQPEKSDDVERSWNDGDKLAVKSMFEKALKQLGLGGKTAVGYGRFTDFEEHDLASEIRSKEELAKKEAAEKKKKDEEERIKTEKEAEEARLKAQKEVAEQKLLETKKSRIEELTDAIENLGINTNEKEQKKIDRQRKILELVKFSFENKQEEIGKLFQSVFDSSLANINIAAIEQLYFEAADAIMNYLQKQNLWNKSPKMMQDKIKEIKREWNNINRQ